VLRLGSSEQGVTEIMAVAEHVNSMAVTASFSVLEKLTGRRRPARQWRWR